MRKMMVLVLMLVTVVCAMSFVGSPSEAELTIMQKGDVFKVVYPTHSTLPVDVTIYDSKGTKVFAEKLDASNGFIRPYNFSQLPRGDYEICIKDEGGEHTKKICTRIKGWAAHVNKMNATEDKYLVAIPHQDGQVTISIHDGENRLLYKADESVEGGYAKVYVLKNVSVGFTITLVNRMTGEEKYFITD